MDYLAWAREFFKQDAYAAQSGIFIEVAEPDYARCVMDVTPQHLNAAGTVMGGALFTLADFTFGVAANTGNKPTVSLNCEINYLNPARGKRLTAEAKCLKSGRSTCSFIIEIRDELATDVAVVLGTGFRKS